MQSIENFLENSPYLRRGIILLFLMLLLLMLTGCQTAAPSTCNVNTAQITPIEIPKPVPGLTNGKMADDLRNLIDEVKKDNVRKNGLVEQLKTCQ